MLKAFLFVMMLLLSACTDSVSTENGEMLLPSEEEGVSTVGDGSSYEITDDTVTHIYGTENTLHESDEFLCNEIFDEPEFLIKYRFYFSPLPTDVFITNNWYPWWLDDDWFYEPATPYRHSSDFGHEGFFADDGRIVIIGNSGWLGPLRDQTYDVDENMEIRVSIQQDHTGPLDSVTLFSNTGVLTQIPEFLEDNFSTDLIVSDTLEWQSILYEERENSRLWQWLMDEENAWRITVRNPRPFSDIFQDISGDLWDNHGIQIFLYAGDATIISRRGIISQIPELQEDNFYFDLSTSGDYEMQYIMRHEQPDSRLWQLLIEMRG
jgi:hypothetical protein